MSKLQNYSKSIEIKKQQVESLVASVESASKLSQAAFPGVDYIDVLFAQRDLRDTRLLLIETKRNSHQHRPHRGLGNQSLDSMEWAAEMVHRPVGEMVCEERLGGLL